MALATSVASGTTTPPCSVHPPKDASEAQLAALAKVPQADAKKAALTAIKDPATVKSTELEAEHGCLVWSFDLKVTDRSGVQEVQVDAGTGKVLSVKHESALHEAAETVKEAIEPKTPIAAKKSTEAKKPAETSPQ